MIREITLSSFRNFNKKRIELSPRVTVILGSNASGKTNILESVFFASTGKSFRARREEEMINYDGEIARIKATLLVGQNSQSKGTKMNLEVVITRGQIDIGTERPEKVPRKRMLVNGISRHLYNFAGNLKVVLFGPWDMDLVTDAPSLRRRFLDNVLSQVDKEYRRSILSYEKGIRQRNRLLLRIRDEGFPRGSLMFWNQLLIKNGNYISQKRSEFIEFVNESKDFNGHDFNIEYDKSAISEGRLEEYKDEEVAAATTLVGPHRDDFQFSILIPQESTKRNLSTYGSRGEQRMGVLWLKLGEMFFIEKKTGEKPTLLLDDIFSELDHEHRDIVFEVSKSQQTIITTADEHFVQDFKISDISLIKL